MTPEQHTACATKALEAISAEALISLPHEVQAKIRRALAHLHAIDDLAEMKRRVAGE